jgi:hypothetical protein
MQSWEEFGLLLLISAVLFVFAIWIILRIRRDPMERERHRRLSVNQYGRLGDAMITEVADNTLYYSYKIRGVVYTTSQDISQLKEVLPDEPERLIGPVTLKYTPRNPANSIVVCETWSGLHGAPRVKL